MAAANLVRRRIVRQRERGHCTIAFAHAESGLADPQGIPDVYLPPVQ